MKLEMPLLLSVLEESHYLLCVQEDQMNLWVPAVVRDCVARTLFFNLSHRSQDQFLSPYFWKVKEILKLTVPQVIYQFRKLESGDVPVFQENPSSTELAPCMAGPSLLWCSCLQKGRGVARSSNEPQDSEEAGQMKASGSCGTPRQEDLAGLMALFTRLIFHLD